MEKNILCFLLKKRLQHKSFSVNITKFLRTTLCMEHLLVDDSGKTFLRISNITLEEFVKKNIQEILGELERNLYRLSIIEVWNNAN